jgi:hypothetical protein
MVCDAQAASVGGVVLLPGGFDVVELGAVAAVVLGAVREVELSASVADVVEEPTIGAAI